MLLPDLGGGGIAAPFPFVLLRDEYVAPIKVVFLLLILLFRVAGAVEPLVLIPLRVVLIQLLSPLRFNRIQRF